MNVYSKKIIRFIAEIKSTAKLILSTEVGMKVLGDRIYDKTCSYPLKIIIFNEKNKLGYFNPNFYELGFNEKLMHVSKMQLHNIIRHELAHYINFINNPYSSCHGSEFRALCERFGWSEDVYRATTVLDDGEALLDEESPVLRKVKKLMALSASSNQNEAELALIKSRQLLLKHNIDENYIGNDDEEKFFLKRILRQPKMNAKMSAIAYILQTFFVTVVFSRGGDSTYLEIVGSSINVEIGEYVAEVLDNELDILWDQARKSNPRLKGMIAKNSFFLGVAKGYCNKINALKKDYDSDKENALIVLEKKLVNAKELIYSRLSSVGSSARHCQNSSAIGEQVGRQLNINPAIHQSEAVTALLG